MCVYIYVFHINSTPDSLYRFNGININYNKGSKLNQVQTWLVSSLTSFSTLNFPKLRQGWVSAQSPQSCLPLWDPMDHSLPGSSVHEVSQARILGWVAMPFSRGSYRLRDRTNISCIFCIVTGFFTTEPPGKPWTVADALSDKSHNSDKLCDWSLRNSPNWDTDAHLQHLTDSGIRGISRFKESRFPTTLFHASDTSREFFIFFFKWIIFVLQTSRAIVLLKAIYNSTYKSFKVWVKQLKHYTLLSHTKPRRKGIKSGVPLDIMLRMLPDCTSTVDRGRFQRIHIPKWWQRFFFIIFIFNWRMLALRCCGSFCYTTMWISHKC